MEPQTEHKFFERPARGGPLDQQMIISRYDAGFYLVDKPNNRVMLYLQGITDTDEWTTDGIWLPLDKPGMWVVADGNELDVIAHDD